MSSNTFPSTGKPKFNPDAAYEAVQDTPAPKEKKPAFNPKEKFEAIQEPVPVEKPAKQTVSQGQPFKPMTDWLNIPGGGYQPMDQANAVAIDDHTKNTAHASNRVNEHLRNIDGSVRNLIYGQKKDLAGRIKSMELGVNPREAGPVNQQVAALESEMREDIPVDPMEVEEFKRGMSENPVMLRKGLAQKVKDFDVSDKSQGGELKGDIYRLDRQGSPEKEEVIAKNVEKLKTGEYDYDVENGRLVKKEGFFASVVRGAKEKGKAYDDYDVYRSGDEKKILDRINQRLAQDPDKAAPVPDGVTGEAGAMLGGLPLKPLIAGGVAGYFSGGTASAAAASAVSVPEMYKLTFGYALPHNYDALKKENPNLSDSEVLQKAIDLTNTQANADALSGAAMGAIGARAALKPSTSLLLQKSVKSALKQVGETVAIEGLGGGAIGATGQWVKNIMAQKAGIPVDESEGMAQQLVGGTFMTLGIVLAGRTGNLLKPSTYNKLLHGLAKAPDEVIVNEFARAQEVGAITPEEAQRVQADIAEQKKIDASIKPDVPEADRIKVQELIKKRNELDSSLETEDKAYHVDTKETIKALNDQINGVSKGSERGELQQLIDKSKIEGATKEYLKDLDEKELKDAFKEISEQAHDPNSANQAVEVFGEEIVNKAKELYPKKESSISVIKPGDIRQPETITIKPKENAIPIEKSDALDVQQQAGDGQPLGEGNVQPEIPSGEKGAPQAEGDVAGQEGVGAPPAEPPVKPAGIHAEHPDTQLSFRGLQETANEFGFEDVKSRDRVSDVQERKNAEITVNEWAEKGEYQKNVDDMLDRIEKRDMVPTAKQRLILEQYLASEKQKARELPKNSEEYNRQLQKVQRIKDIGQVARQEAGAALRLPDEGSRPHPITDEVDAMIAKKEANSVDELTEKQKAEVEAQVEKYKRASDDAAAKTSALEEQVAKLEADKEFKKAKSTTKKTKKTTEERIAYRKGEIEAAREALKKLRTGESGLSSVPLPGVRELMAIAPHVKNIMIDLADQGISDLKEVVRHLHGEFKNVLDGLTEKDIHNIIAGKYNEKKKPLSALQARLKDLQDEAKLINQLEALQSGMKPKTEKAKRERNQKIKELRDKIKDYRQAERDADKFYGESDVAERKLDKLRDELERIQGRKQKEKLGSKEEVEMSSRERELRDQIKEAQAEWDKEKSAAKEFERDYSKMETERNRQLKRVSDLKEKLSELQNGIKNKANSKSKNVDTPEIEALKKQVSDAEAELNKTIATEKRIKGMEDELQRLIERKPKEAKEVNKREVTDREQELKDQIDAERKAFQKEQADSEKFYKEELDDDAKSLIAIKKRNNRRAQEIKDKIAKGDFEKETRTSIFDREDVKKNYPRLRKDALDAIAAKEEAQHEFDLALFNDQMAKRGKLKKGADLLGKIIHTSKSIMAGIDDSATFVQNGLAMLANPKEGAKAWLEHWKDAFSEARLKRELAALHQSADWDIIQKSGLDITGPESTGSIKLEEAFEKNLLAKSKAWKHTGGVFERAFISMGNNMRLNLFRKRMAMLLEGDKTFETHPQEFKDAARVINEMTGRGKLEKHLEMATPWITPFIWAPRMLSSTINLLGLSDAVLGWWDKGYYQNLTPAQRKFALGQVGRGVGIGVALMGTAALGGAKVDYDPRSSTFGDVIMGDHHYNVFGRFTPVVKALVQAASGTKITKKGVTDLDSGEFGAKNRLDPVAGFFRGKVTPFVGASLNLAAGKDYFTQKPFGIQDMPAALLQPMVVKELREGWEHDGTMTILNRALPAFEGLKTSDERDFEKKSDSGGSSSGNKGKASKKGKPSKNSK
jgi:hypothetical protein